MPPDSYIRRRIDENIGDSGLAEKFDFLTISQIRSRTQQNLEAASSVRRKF